MTNQKDATAPTICFISNPFIQAYLQSLLLNRKRKLNISKLTSWFCREDLSRWSQTDTYWYNESYTQIMSATLPISRLNRNPPFINTKDTLECEVELPSTPYKNSVSQTLPLVELDETNKNAGCNCLKLKNYLPIVFVTFCLSHYNL